jgi:hypothetical protein
MSRRFYLCAVLLAGILVAGTARADGVKQFVEMTGGPLSSLPDAPCGSPVGMIVPADTANAQQCAIMVNVGANSASIGDLNCSASRCARLAAGATMTICTRGEIDCYSTAGTTIAITKVGQ